MQGTLIDEKQWKKDLAELRRNRDAFWDYVATIKRIRDSSSYMAQYATFSDFLEAECGMQERHARHLISGCEVRQSLGTIVPEDSLPSHEGQLRELAKIPDAGSQRQVFASVQETCEAEGREPTAKDYRNAARAFVPETQPAERNGKPKPDWKDQRALAIKHAEAFMRAVDDLNETKESPKHGRIITTTSQAIEALKDW